MLSKVLKDTELKLSPVYWRRHAISSAPPGNAEVAELRARIAELEALMETKSRQAHAAGVRAGEESARHSLETGVREQPDSWPGSSPSKRSRLPITPRHRFYFISYDAGSPLQAR